MNKLCFETPEQLREFYLSQGFFAMYYCDTESVEFDIDHHVLIKSGDAVSDGCYGREVIDLRSDQALEILRHFLQTGRTSIHPKDFTINH